MLKFCPKTKSALILEKFVDQSDPAPVLRRTLRTKVWQTKKITLAPKEGVGEKKVGTCFEKLRN